MDSKGAVLDSRLPPRPPLGNGEKEESEMEKLTGVSSGRYDCCLGATVRSGIGDTDMGSVPEDRWTVACLATVPSGGDVQVWTLDFGR